VNLWMPQPVVSAALFVVWLLLQGRLSIAQALMGALLAIVIPLLTKRFTAKPLVIRRPLLALRFFLMLAYDIVVANLAVARLIVRPGLRLRPTFVTIVLELRGDLAIATLLAAISLTPGTVSCQLSRDERTLLIHVLDAANPETLGAEIKARYERPLMDIFGC